MNKIIKEDYVSNKIAKLLKEKGFDVPCRAYYDMGALKEDVTVPRDWSHSNFIDHTTAPTLQMAMKWLREKHIIIVISPEHFNVEAYCSAWGVEIWWDDNYEEMSETYLTYEDACGAAIKHVLENLN